ncbi:hypothetical protein QJQ45_026240 [Haematococcus lacustris]|nr:hypothetical protein QJQ45_026240 [Haematococcus lacustris]
MNSAGPFSSNSSPAAAPSAAAAAPHVLGLPRIGKTIAEKREYVFDPATQIGVGIDPGVTQAVSAASGVWDPKTRDQESVQLMAGQLCRWKLTKGQVNQASSLDNAHRNTERWLAPIQPHLLHLAAASSAGTLPGGQPGTHHRHPGHLGRGVGGVPGPLVGTAAADALEEDMAEVPMQRHGRAKQLVVLNAASGIVTQGGWGADAVLRACCKVVCWLRGTDRRRGRLVLVDEYRTTRVSSSVNGKQPCEEEVDHEEPTRPAGWKPPAGKVEQRLVRPAWSQQRDQPVRGLMWCPVVAPHTLPQPPCKAATQPKASEPGPSTPSPARRSKRTKAEQAAEPTQPTKGKGKGKGKPA